MQTLKKLQKTVMLVAVLCLAFTFLVIAPQHSLAATPTCLPNSNPPCNPTQTPAQTPQTAEAAACSNTDTAPALNNCLQQSNVVKDLQTLVDVLAAGVGVVSIAMIILGGIQYSMAGDNASAVSAAKQRIINALIALVAFIFMWAFVQWLIPGGVFG